MQLVRAIVFIFLVMAGSLVMAQPNSPDQPIGKVIFATGDAYADQVKVQSGAPIYVGQSLSTSVGGHLHVRMIDGAFLSLRPSSAAKVSLYTIDLEQPANNQIRIDVQYGVVRSVTGKGGEDNHSTFRLNTPVAAIGIRGTDFIVYTDAVSSVVDLRQGGIEMTPLSDTCSPYTLGACADGQSVTLLERDPGLVAEVHAAQQKATRVSKASAPVVPDKVEPAHPVEDQSLKKAKEAPVVISTAPTAAEAKAAESTADSSKAQAVESASTDGVTAKSTTGAAETGKTASATADSAKISANTSTPSNPVNESQAKTTAIVNGGSTSSTLTVKTSTGSTTLVTPASAPTTSANVAATSAGATVDVASIAPVTAEVGAKESVTSEIAGRVIVQATTDGSLKQVEKEVVVAQALVTTAPVPSAVAAKAQPFYWGRWTSYAENAEQNIVRDPARNKQVFAANTVMLLASAESGTPSLPKTGVVNFRQDKAEAHVFNSGALNDASVNNAALAVNFDQNNFATSMDVSSRSLARGTEHLRATGTLDANTGSLRSTVAGSNMTVAGKVADGASHAAYIFNQDSTGIVGAINWAAQ